MGRGSTLGTFESSYDAKLIKWLHTIFHDVFPGGRLTNRAGIQLVKSHRIRHGLIRAGMTRHHGLAETKLETSPCYGQLSTNKHCIAITTIEFNTVPSKSAI
jgi:hypothetical protein